MTPIARFLAKIDPQPGGCWLWRGAISTTGYGNFWCDSRYMSAHRFAYMAFVGPVPDGQRENTLRGNTLPAANVAKMECPNGHSYTAENTYVQSTGRGGRSCRACRKASNDRLTERRRAARKVA